jgi:hypothetical protein
VSADELATRIHDADFEDELYVEPCLDGASLTIYSNNGETSILLDDRGMRQLRLAITRLERERKEARDA